MEMDLDAGRVFAHILLDMVSAFDGNREGGGVVPRGLASRRISEVDLVSSSVDERTGDVAVDISPVLTGAHTLTFWFVQQLAHQSGRSEIEIISHAREAMDAAWATSLKR